jgi:adenylate kinase
MPCPCRCLMTRSNLIFILVAIGTSLLVYWHVKRSSQVAPSIVPSKVIFAFLGAPGAGKGTLAEACIKNLGYTQLSTGDLIRNNIKQGTELGKKLQEYSSKGALAPDDIINELVKEWLAVHARTSSHIILDGFPRTQAQAAWLIDLLKNQYPDYRLRVISLNISDEEAVQRIAGRLTCSNPQCKAIYNKKQFPGEEKPVCLACKSSLIVREDDKEEVVRERIKIYKETSKPLINFFDNDGVLIEQIDVEGKDEGQVFEDFKKLT